MGSIQFVVYFYIPSACINMARNIPLSALPIYIVDDLKQSEVITGLVLSMIGLGKLLNDLPAGRLVESVSVRKAMLLSGIMMTLACSLAAIAPYVWSLCIALALFGAGMALTSVAWQEMISTTVPLEKRPQVSVLLGATSRLSTAIAPLIGAAVFSVHGIRALFLVKGSFAGASSVPFMTTDRFSRRVESLNPNTVPLTMSDIFRLKKEAILRSAAFITSMFFLRETRRSVLVLVAHRHGWSISDVSLLLSLSYLFDFATLFFAERLYKSRGIRFVAWATVSLFAIAMFLMALGSYISGFLWLAAGFAGLASGISAGIAMLIGAEISPTEGAAKFAGLWRLVCDFGDFVAPFFVDSLIALMPAEYAMLLVTVIGFAGVYVFAHDHLHKFIDEICDDWSEAVRKTRRLFFAEIGESPVLINN